MCPELLYEINADKRKALAVLSPHAKILGNVEDAKKEHLRSGRTIFAVYGGVPCQPVAPSGFRLGLADLRAKITVNSLPDVAKIFDALMFTAENLLGLSSLNGGEMLKALDSRALGNGFVRTPKAIEAHNVVDYRAPLDRNRLIPHYECHDMLRALGQAPRLRFRSLSKVHIKDVMLDDAEVPDSCYLRGRLVHRANPIYSDVKAKVVADLHIAPDDALFLGSKVYILLPSLLPLNESTTASDSRVIWTVTRIFGAVVTLFDDRTDGKGWLRRVPRMALSSQLKQSLEVLGSFGIARAMTCFGVEPHGSAKQLSLRNGRASKVLDKELF